MNRVRASFGGGSSLKGPVQMRRRQRTVKLDFSSSEPTQPKTRFEFVFLRKSEVNKSKSSQNFNYILIYKYFE